jgi:3-carboxy-cis,cis-muconate cycloisomerase
VIPTASGAAISAALDGLALDPGDLGPATTGSGVPVPGLVRALRARVGLPHGDFVHWGATSQDAMDTGLVLRLRCILEVLEARLDELVEHLCELAELYATLPMAGRTRSQIATPTTFGLRIAGWMAPLARCRDRLAELQPRLLVVQFGGATGNLAALGEQGVPVMESLATDLGLGCPAKPWHVERDGIVELANWLAMVSGLLGRIGADLILSGRSEIAEVAAGAGGDSSTMPQKSNPVLAETLKALASANGAQAGLAQQALLQTEERDGAAWAIEWLCLPQMLVTTAAGLRHATTLAADLRPDSARMADALETNGGAAHAEAMAFALAEAVGLPEAQSILKAAVQAQARDGGTLAAHVGAACTTHNVPPFVLDLAAHARSAESLVRRATAKPSGRRQAASL